jgi:hypothetical protein
VDEVKINADLQEKLLAKLASGWTSERCATWLANTHGVKVTGRAVRALAQRTRTERADVAKATARGAIARRLPADLEVLARRTRALRRIVLKLEREVERDGPEHVDLYLRALEQLRKMLDMTLKFSGAAEPDNVIAGLADFLSQGFDEPRTADAT